MNITDNNPIQRLRQVVDRALTFSDDVADDRAVPFDDLTMRERALAAFDAELQLLDSDSQAAEVDRLRRGLESIRDCTPDMWACSMAEQTLNGSPFEDALAASKQYDTDEEFDAATSMRDKCVENLGSLVEGYKNDLFATDDEDYKASLGFAVDALDKAIRSISSLTLEPLEPGQQ